MCVQCVKCNVNDPLQDISSSIVVVVVISVVLDEFIKPLLLRL